MCAFSAWYAVDNLICQCIPCFFPILLQTATVDSIMQLHSCLALSQRLNAMQVFRSPCVHAAMLCCMSAGDMPMPRYQHGAVFVNARLHISGGAVGGGRMVEDSSSVVTLDTAAGAWVHQEAPEEEDDWGGRAVSQYAAAQAISD